MQVSYRGVNGTATTLDVASSDFVGAVRAWIEERDALPAGQQCLVFGGKALADGRTLADCGIRTGAVLQLTQRVQGSAQADGRVAEGAAPIAEAAARCGLAELRLEAV